VGLPGASLLHGGLSGAVVLGYLLGIGFHGCHILCAVTARVTRGVALVRIAHQI
jgi:hypothetical protein